MDMLIWFVYIMVGTPMLSCVLLILLCGYVLFGWFPKLFHDKAQIHIPDYSRPILKDVNITVGFCRCCGKVIHSTSSSGMWSISPVNKDECPPHVKLLEDEERQ